MKAYAEISQLQKNIDDFQLGPIDLTIEPETITALVGNNGTGKSTLLKLMMNLASRDSGDIKLFNTSVSNGNESWKRNVAYLPQTIIGMDAYTGNTLKALIESLYPNWDDSLFIEMINLFDVPLNKRFGKLSQGVRQKLNLALTVARNTPLLVLDEPTAFMDIPSKKFFMDILVDWMDKGDRSIIITSHQVEDIKKLSDYLFVLRNGKAIGNFEKEALTENYKRYWLNGLLPNTAIPGEVSRANLQIISNKPEKTEVFLQKNNIGWIDRKSLELEEIITLLLTT
ncbi:ATP-binding cassette domain-containing protein [Oceanobacillus sp. 143]|uniref:ABC transporter ATP-binding protein n=1 Tax=Oceanobacillus zhaokaii TaxID=2052660 RepID=A0A345PL60_9BACI|nr:ABC transporter ATP-binding protein [Oceanobacillus zhaokaii]AXI10740.1 ABC transporter ATP-binding protein [Oceanobacillus zhaokaii]QGS69664.1 ATP-binding cassette domain-containing protein [Oceanobacillus sp. 143]